MKKSILTCIGCAVILWATHGALGQPALEELENRLDRLLDPATRPPATSPESPAAAAEPGYLGLFADNAAAEGAIVTSVETDGPADAAGIQKRDIIVSANATAVRSIDDLSRVLDRLSAGDIVDFEVLRGGRMREISVELARRPSSAAPAPSAGPSAAAPADADPTSARPTLGVRVLPVDDATRVRFGLAVRRGAVVESVRSGSPADRAGLAVGTVIVSIDGRRVDTPDDLIGYIRSARGPTVELVVYRGDRIERLEVDLRDSGVPTRLPPGTAMEPPLSRTPIFGEDRPALRKIESVIDRLVAPPATYAPAVGADDTIELRGQVETLHRQVELLQQRIAELERRLAESGER